MHLRRTGIPCGHSAYLDSIIIMNTFLAEKKIKETSGNR